VEEKPKKKSLEKNKSIKKKVDVTTWSSNPI
jgi:hypothetical protein